MAKGRIESRPEDYDINRDPKLVALRKARRRIEDMRMSDEFDLRL